MGEPGRPIVFRDEEAERRARRARALGQLLDNSLPIPGTGRRIGLDAIIGLVPGVGDLIGAVLSGYIVLEAARAQVPALTLARMLGNIAIDTLAGVVPALGDVFDAAWKANLKNAALLERHVATTQGAVTRERGVVGVSLLAVAILVLIAGAGVALGIFVARLLWNVVGTR